MAVQNRSTLKSYFQRGDKPTEAQFSDLIDSMLNSMDDGQLGLDDYDPSKSYNLGQGVFNGLVLLKANKLTTGIFNAGDWNAIQIGWDNVTGKPVIILADGSVPMDGNLNINGYNINSLGQLVDSLGKIILIGSTRALVDSNGNAIVSFQTRAGGVGILTNGGGYYLYFKNDNITAQRTLQAPDEDGIIATQAYAQSLVARLWNDQGNFDASGNTFPTAANTTPLVANIKEGFIWTISAPGVLGGVDVNQGDTVRALIDNPGTTSTNWAIAEGNLGYTPENSANKKNDFSVIDNTGFPTTKAVNDRFAKETLYFNQLTPFYWTSDIAYKITSIAINAGSYTITYGSADGGHSIGDAYTIGDSLSANTLLIITPDAAGRIITVYYQ